jgi:moderate conductance mechanosensitive channel
MKMNRPVALLVSSVLVIIALSDARGENAGHSISAAAPAGASAPGITPEAARRTLDVLEDAGQRARTIEMLRVIAGTLPPAQPAQAAGSAPRSTGQTTQPSTSAAATPAPSEPSGALAGASSSPTVASDSLAAQTLLQTSEWIKALADNIEAGAVAVTHFPMLWHWVEEIADDPYARDRLLDAAWKLIVVFGCALMLEWLAQRAVRRPITALEQHAGRVRGDKVGTERLPAHADEHHARFVRGFARTWRLLQRLPLALARLALELLPVAACAAVGNLLLGTPMGTPQATRLVILAVINAYVLCRVVMALTRMLVMPNARQLRLVHVRDETAAYVEIWVRRIIIVGVFGIALAEVARLLGLHRAGYAALIRIVMLFVHLFVVIIVLQCRRAVADWLRVPRGHGAFAFLRGRLADVWHLIAIFFVMALWVVWALRVQNGYTLMFQFFLTTLAVVVAARIAGIIALGALDRIFRVGPDFAARFPTLEARANRYYAALRGTISALIAVVALLVSLEVWGIDALAWFESGRIGGRLLSAILTVAIASAVALAIWESVNAAIERHIAQLGREARYARVTRLRTLLPMLRTALLVVILTVLGLTALSEIGIDIAPLLAGAGIVGVAIGFGSQKLVQDLITGLFLLLENAMQVGDFVTVSGLSGKVENLSIRTIRLRAVDGSVHIIPFSAVTSVTNTNRGIGNASISVNVAYKEDTDRVGDVLKEIAAEMRQDPEFKTLMRGDLALWGVDKIDAGVVTILGQIECTDAGRWSVQREFNRRMKKRFQELDIEIAAPGPTMVLQRLPERSAAIPRAVATR